MSVYRHSPPLSGGRRDGKGARALSTGVSPLFNFCQNFNFVILVPVFELFPLGRVLVSQVEGGASDMDHDDRVSRGEDTIICFGHGVTNAVWATTGLWKGEAERMGQRGLGRNKDYSVVIEYQYDWVGT